MTKFAFFELVLIQQPEVNKHSFFFNKYSSGALASHLGHFGLRFSRFRETIPILKNRISFAVEYIFTPYGPLTREKLPYLSLFGLSQGTFPTNKHNHSMKKDAESPEIKKNTVYIKHINTLELRKTY